MSESPIAYDSEERIFTMDDVVQLYTSMRKKILRVALIGAVLGFSLTLLKAPKHKIEASFKEGVEKSSTDSIVKDLLGGLGTQTNQPQAVALMKSFQVLKFLVEKEGLQASVPRSNALFKVLRRVGENLKAEMQKPLPEVDWFSFQNVRYEEEANLNLSLRFSDATHFQLLDENGKSLATSEIGKNVSLPTVSFTVTRAPSHLNFNKTYRLIFVPWIAAAKSLRESLQITSHKTNKSIYDLTIYNRDRKLGVRILNGLMAAYQNYLKVDHDQIAAEQINYLEQRQQELYSKIGQIFNEHADHLTQTIGTKGFIGLEQEIKSYLGPHEEMRAKLLSIEIELSWLMREQKSPLLVMENTSFGESISKLASKVQNFEQQRDLLELSLSPHIMSTSWELRVDELDAIRKQREEAQQLVDTIQKDGEWSIPAEFSWARDFRTANQKLDFVDYLSNHLRLLSVREKILTDRFTHFSDNNIELDGIDLETAHTLFIEYNGRLDEVEASIRYYTHLKEEMQHRDFEISSLSSVLKDAVSQELIARAAAIAMQLKDEKYRSEKEGERWNEEIALQRKILSEHLIQLIKIEELNSGLLREKIHSLQKVSLDCINQNISVLQTQINDSIVQRKEMLQEEKKVLLEKMQELRVLAADLPERWKQENWLELKTQMGTKIMTVLTELVESKTISNHLHHVESKPLDFATVSLLAQKPRLFMMAILGAFGAAFAFFFFTLMRSLINGFPTSSHKLKAMRYPFSGLISTFCDGPEVALSGGPDLETMRQLALFLDRDPQSTVITLVGGKGPDYSYSFVQNLARAGQNAILIRCDFDAKFSSNSRPGLLQWLNAEIEEIPLRRGDGYDFISSGGFSTFSVEALQSKRFTQLLEQCKINYDRVIIWLRSPIDTAETKVMLHLSQKAIVTVTGEQTELLTPFMNWAYHEGNSRLTFISTQ